MSKELESALQTIDNIIQILDKCGRYDLSHRLRDIAEEFVREERGE